MMSSNHEIYHIKSTLSEKTIKRTKASFYELREVLIKVCPGCIIPPVSKKQTKDLSKNSIAKQSSKLKRFLDYVLEHPLIGKTLPIYQFLTFENEENFMKTMKGYNNLNPPKDLNEIFTLEGQAKIGINKELLGSYNEILPGLKALPEGFKE